MTLRLFSRLRRETARPYFLVAAAGLFGFAALAVDAACQSPAGMYCQQQSECRVGLVCQKPPGASEASFGVCAPALRGEGESCLLSADCQGGLRCSNEDGMDNGDERHGICEPLPDGGSDLRPIDM